MPLLHWHIRLEELVRQHGYNSTGFRDKSLCTCHLWQTWFHQQTAIFNHVIRHFFHVSLKSLWRKIPLIGRLLFSIQKIDIQIVTLFALVWFEKRKHMRFVTLVGFIFRMADGADLSVGYSNFNVFPYILPNESREHANCIITPASVLPP